jgi:pyrroline-5-carboxylate reductase
MTQEKLAFIGGGNMGRALIGGLLQRNTKPEQIAVCDAYEPTRAALGKDFAVITTPDNAKAIDGASVVVLAVKPQDAGNVLTPLVPIFQRNRPVLVSVCAGLRISSLESWCGGNIPVVRSMPNRPALVGAGATGLFAGPNADASHRAKAESIMRAVGEVVWVPTEDALDVVTALSGSGPAYFFLLAELMMQAGKELGLDEDAARRLAVATLHGAGTLAQSSDGDLARLRKEVTSKGGTTEAALRVFDAADLRTIVARALDAATRRGRELAAQFGG